jgi:hypothetical protein
VDDAPTGKPSAADLLARADELMRKNRSPAPEDDLPVLDMLVSVPEPENMRASELTDWDETCEMVYGRVMQQMDLYAEFGLKDRINRDLRPMLSKFTEDLARELSKEMAQHIREYVAQAIDEEAAALRRKLSERQ